VELVFVAPPSHLLQYGAASLLECLVELRQEPSVEPELELCQTDPKFVILTKQSLCTLFWQINFGMPMF